MKQFIIHLNDQKIADKKFIIEDLDATHLLIRGEMKDEIMRKVEEWMDEVRCHMGIVTSLPTKSVLMFHVFFAKSFRMYFPALRG